MMIIEEIDVVNMKCDGCATNIKIELLKLPGVSCVEVFRENDTVIVSYDDNDRDAIILKLQRLGYPEATERNCLVNQLKSYSSCMTEK
jgi:copper chaperone